MKKFFLVLFSVISLSYFVSCVRDNGTSGYTQCAGVDVDQDSTALLKYAGDSIMVTRDVSGLYYQILDSGIGATPTAASVLTVSYKGRLLNNVVFDSTVSTSNLGGMPLGSLIPGWQIGVEKIKKGGHVKLLIPSALAWGCPGSGNAIPSNAPVYFDIYLVDIN